MPNAATFLFAQTAVTSSKVLDEVVRGESHRDMPGQARTDKVASMNSARRMRAG
jgi:hypothetical protein